MLHACVNPPNDPVECSRLLCVVASRAEPWPDNDLILLPNNLLEPIQLVAGTAGGEIATMDEASEASLSMQEQVRMPEPLAIA